MGVSIPNDDEFPDHAHEGVNHEVETRVSSPEDFNEELNQDADEEE